MRKDSYWWSEAYGFFGRFYFEGDHSLEGYLTSQKQTLQERTISEVDGVERLLQLKKGDSVLDIPCGYGRHSIELARRGYNVIGSDLNGYHLRLAREEVKNQHALVSFVHEDMREIKYHEKFDSVLNLFYSFGFFDSDRENEQVLKNFFEALKPGGKFLFHTDVNVPRILFGKYKASEERTIESGKRLRILDKYNSKTKRVEGEWTIIDKNGNEETKTYSVRVYDKSEFETLCRKTGFSSIQTFSDWKGNPYLPDSEDMIVVATK